MALGMYKILRRSSRKPPNIPGCNTVVKFFTIDKLIRISKPKIIAEIPSNNAMIRDPYKKPWPRATLLPTVAAHNKVKGKT